MGNKWEAHCIKCNGTKLVFPNEASEGASIICNDCGERLGTVEDVKAYLAAETERKVREAIAKANSPSAI